MDNHLYDNSNVLDTILDTFSKSINDTSSKDVNKLLLLRHKAVSIILDKFVEDKMNLETVPQNICRLLKNSSQGFKYKEEKDITENDYIYLEIPFDFYKIQLKIKLLYQNIISFRITLRDSFVQQSEYFTPISTNEANILYFYIRAIINLEFLDSNQTPIETLLCVIINSLKLLRPLTTESISTDLKLHGVSTSDILSMNSLIRTLLYKLKRCGLLIMSDDEEFDGTDNIQEQITLTSDIDIIYNNIIECIIKHIGINKYRECLRDSNQFVYIKDIIIQLYTTTLLGKELNPSDFSERILKHINEYYNHNDVETNLSASNILGVVLYALRMVLFKDTSEVNNPKNQELAGLQ